MPSQVFVVAAQSAVMIVALGCTHPSRRGGELAPLADSVLAHTSPPECTNIDASATVYRVGVRACVAKALDTVVVVEITSDSAVKRVIRTWETSPGASRAYEELEQRIVGQLGAGTEACVLQGALPGRQWSASHYYVLLLRNAASDTLQLTYQSESPRFRPGCPSRS